MPATPPPTTSAVLLTGSSNSSSGSRRRGTRHRHPHDVLRLLGGQLLLAAVHPRAVLADVGHVEEVLVDAAFAQRVPEQRLVRSRGAGSHDHAVETLLTDGVRYLRGRVGGTDEQSLFRVNDIVQGQGVVDHPGHVDHAADVGTAVAHEDADPGLLLGDIPLHRVDPILGQPTPAVVEELTALRAGPAGRHHRLRDVDGSLEGPADEDAGAGGLHGVHRVGLAESVRVELDAECPGEVLGIGRRAHAHREHHHVELFLHHPVRVGGVADGDVLRLGDLSADGDVAPDEPHPGKPLRPLIEALEVLAVRPDIVVEDGGLGVGVVILGQDHLLLSVRAADRRAVGVGARDDLPRADAVDPGDVVRMPLVRGPQDLALERPGGTQQPLVVETGYDVLHRPVAVVAPQSRDRTPRSPGTGRWLPRLARSSLPSD